MGSSPGRRAAWIRGGNSPGPGSASRGPSGTPGSALSGDFPSLLPLLPRFPHLCGRARRESVCGKCLPLPEGTVRLRDYYLQKQRERLLREAGLRLVLREEYPWGASSWKVPEGPGAKINRVPPSEPAASRSAAGGSGFPAFSLKSLACPSLPHFWQGTPLSLGLLTSKTGTTLCIP